MQTTAWASAGKTSTNVPIVSRSGSMGVAAVVAFACLAGTGGVTSPSYFIERQERGYAFFQVRPSGRSLMRHLRTSQENIAQIRAIFRLSMADIGSVFKVSRQSVYNWIAGEKPSPENVEKLNDVAAAADLFLAYGSADSSYLVRRKLENGKTLMDSVREGGSAQDAARSLLQIAQKETSQREALQRRLANRIPATPDYSEIGSPMLNEDLG
jgi:transcriptional regulator with XRE-family HTH domain